MQLQTSNLEGLLQKHVEMAVEIKNLDTDLQMLVYEQVVMDGIDWSTMCLGFLDGTGNFFLVFLGIGLLFFLVLVLS